MAMYKVSVTVYKNPEGKTMFLPTFLRAVGSLLLAVGLFTLAALVMALVQTKGKMKLSVTVTFSVLVIGLVVLGIFLRRWSARNAQTSYQKALSQQKNQQ